MPRKPLQTKFIADVDRFIRRIAIAIDTNLVLATPVDTGRARSNWLVTTGSPSNSTVSPISAQSAISRGESAVNSVPKFTATSLGNYPTIYITNNVSYIGDLNRGSSRQAPAGFVETAIRQGIAVARSRFGR